MRDDDACSRGTCLEDEGQEVEEEGGEEGGEEEAGIGKTEKRGGHLRRGTKMPWLC